MPEISLQSCYFSAPETLLKQIRHLIVLITDVAEKGHTYTCMHDNNYQHDSDHHHKHHLSTFIPARTLHRTDEPVAVRVDGHDDDHKQSNESPC
mmetsp:Transcript_44996/g.72269  ORF Transcript_44996/g.72269 Transcript_44996/m.72269 type:complete len:94 (+) Transcript_44996:974-1255(+)